MIKRNCIYCGKFAKKDDERVCIECQGHLATQDWHEGWERHQR